METRGRERKFEEGGRFGYPLIHIIELKNLSTTVQAEDGPALGEVGGEAGYSTEKFVAALKSRHAKRRSEPTVETQIETEITREYSLLLKKYSCCF